MTTNTDIAAGQITTNLHGLENEGQASRDALAKKADSGDLASLGTTLAQIARAEGEHRFWVTAQQALEGGYTGIEAMEAALKEAVRHIAYTGADDTWSGRHNDVRRSYFDGIRTFVQLATAYVEGAL